MIDVEAIAVAVSITVPNVGGIPSAAITFGGGDRAQLDHAARWTPSSATAPTCALETGQAEAALARRLWWSPRRPRAHRGDRGRRRRVRHDRSRVAHWRSLWPSPPTSWRARSAGRDLRTDHDGRRHVRGGCLVDDRCDHDARRRRRRQHQRLRGRHCAVDLGRWRRGQQHDPRRRVRPDQRRSTSLPPMARSPSRRWPMRASHPSSSPSPCPSASPASGARVRGALAAAVALNEHRQRCRRRTSSRALGVTASGDVIVQATNTGRHGSRSVPGASVARSAPAAARRSRSRSPSRWPERRPRRHPRSDRRRDDRRDSGR